MAETPDRDQQTEAPTDKRRRDAAQKGDILRSKELGIAVVMLLGAGYLAVMGATLVDGLRDALRQGLSIERAAVADFTPGIAMLALLKPVALPMLGLFVATIVAAVIGSAMTGALSFNPTLIAPKASRLSPGSGLKRMFGTHGLAELGKSVFKVLLLGAIGVWALARIAGDVAVLGFMDGEGAAARLGSLTATILFVLAGGLVLIAGIDVPLQYRQLMGKLRMTKQEVKDEYKQTEGSPELKGALRRRQREVARRNVREAVATAHVVLTNPTEFAVALRYDRTRDRAPVVVAKGRGVTAAVIRELAAENATPVLQYPLLARAVYYTSKTGQEIRDDLYVAVASILAFVFGLERDAATPRPEVEVPADARFDEDGRRLQ